MSNQTMGLEGSQAFEGVEGTSVPDVLMEQIDAAVGNIEKLREGLKPYEEALKNAQVDQSRLQAALEKATKPEVVQVYELDVAAAGAIVSSTEEEGVVAAGKIVDEQAKLEKLLAQLKKADPNNPLVTQM